MHYVQQDKETQPSNKLSFRSVFRLLWVFFDEYFTSRTLYTRPVYAKVAKKTSLMMNPGKPANWTSEQFMEGAYSTHAIISTFP